MAPGRWIAFFSETGMPAWVAELEADDIAGRLLAQFPFTRDLTVLDYGCGDGAVACRLAATVGHVYWWDPAPGMQVRARATLAATPNAHFWHPDAVGAPVPDVIVVNSVLQYLTRETVAGLLQRWRDLLAPGGRVILGDLLPPRLSPVVELAQAVGFFARRAGLLRSVSARAGEVVRYFGDRRSVPLSRYDEGDLTRLAQLAGFDVARLPANISYRTRRYTLVLTRRGRAAAAGDPARGAALVPGTPGLAG